MHGTYEQEQLQNIETWGNRPPSGLARTLGFFSAPLAWAAQQLVSDETMEQALQAAFGAAGAFSGSDDLLKEASENGFIAQTIADLHKAPLHVCDSLADSTAKWAKGIAAAEGAATGITGFAGLAIDIPAVIILAIRTIRKIGFCYGFDTALERERPFVLLVLSAGAANSSDEKQRAIAAIAGNPEDKQLVPGHEQHILRKEGFTAAIRNLAKQLATNLTRRKAAQTIPLIGGGVGAAMNVMFIADIAEAAVRLYQRRRLEVSAWDTLPTKAGP